MEDKFYARAGGKTKFLPIICEYYSSLSLIFLSEEITVVIDCYTRKETDESQFQQLVKFECLCVLYFRRIFGNYNKGI